ncbi:ankyrin repeat domain-containing protein [Luteolibacter yonseiensis]|uniref:Ankyrin repeat domain-containing protein n=1 Tax=Luteolibacter yonseiensis TaxID=1144680 RepID=A0A934R5G9_9BACT|nr:ankyrin repeat domain-containing protein [Luteolibacter yonseiensis]MBK1816737.1 ankyrin repeat domain-containing protein [Luteolibacter yonseiensis]
MSITNDPEITAEEEARYAELQQLALDSARTGDVAMLVPMLDAGMPVNLADEKGNSLLMLAAYHGHLPLVRLLLESGAAPDQRNARNQTALAGVAFKGGLEIARLLVQYGADPNADQGGGRFPIQFAAMFGNPDIVEFLSSLQPTRKVPWSVRWLGKITGVIRRRVVPMFGSHWRPSTVP